MTKNFPNTYLGDVLDYLQLNKSELFDTILTNIEIQRFGKNWKFMGD